MISNLVSNVLGSKKVQAAYRACGGEFLSSAFAGLQEVAFPNPDMKTVKIARSIGPGRPIHPNLATQILGIVNNGTELSVAGQPLSATNAITLVKHNLASLFNRTDNDGHYFELCTNNGRTPGELLAEIAAARTRSTGK
jgi:hypothetical protein